MSKLTSTICFEEGVYKGQTNYKASPHGIGKMRAKNGSLYQGHWLNGKRHGMGIMKFSSGNYYKGHFVNGLKHGYGEFYYSQQQEKYCGYWKFDKKHGQGKYYFRDGSSFKGKFRNDRRNGIGRKISSKLIYQGMYRDGYKHGDFYFLHRNTGQCSLVQYRRDKKVQIQNLKGDNARSVQLKFKYIVVDRNQNNSVNKQLDYCRNTDIDTEVKNKSDQIDAEINSKYMQNGSESRTFNKNEIRCKQTHVHNQEKSSQYLTDKFKLMNSENLSLIPEESETRSYCHSDVSQSYLLFGNDSESVFLDTLTSSQLITAPLENKILESGVNYILKKRFFKDVFQPEISTDFISHDHFEQRSMTDSDCIEMDCSTSIDLDIRQSDGNIDLNHKRSCNHKRSKFG